MSSVESFISFLDVCIHTLLHSRAVYPVTLFERRAVYGCVVWQCRSPLVCHSLHKLFDELKPLLNSNSVESIIIPFHSAEGVLLERYVINVDFAAVVSDSVTSSDVEEQLAAAVRHLQALEGSPPILPKGATWTVQLQAHCARQEGAPAIPFWVRVDPGDNSFTGDANCGEPSSAISPVRGRVVLKTIRARNLSISLGRDLV